jgi:hypothetical protein
MPIPQNVQRIVVEDYAAEDRALVGRLATTYNQFAEEITQILQGNVDFDNLKIEVITFNVTVDANGIPIQQTKIRLNTNRLFGMNIIKLSNITSPITFPTAAPFVTYSENGQGIVTIEHVAGLVANNEYQISVIVFNN